MEVVKFGKSRFLRRDAVLCCTMLCLADEKGCLVLHVNINFKKTDVLYSDIHNHRMFCDHQGANLSCDFL